LVDIYYYNNIMYIQYLLKYKIVVFLLFICNISYASIADTIIIKEVLVVEKLLTKKKESGLKFQKIDTLALSNLANRSLSELLSENTPVFIKTYGRGSMATASFRGTAASHTKVLWNDIEINSPMLGMVDFSLIPTWFMDEVNLSYGAASVSKSAGALGGNVDLSNVANWNKGFSIHTLSSIGSFNTYDQFFSLNYSNNKFSSNTKVFYSASDNDFSFYNKDVPAQVDLNTGEISFASQKQSDADYKKYGLLQKLYYKLSLKNTLSFKLWSQFSDRSLPQLSSNESNKKDSDGKYILNNINKQKDISTRISADWKHYFDYASFKLNVGYINTDLDYYLDIAQNRAGKQVVDRTIDSKSAVETYTAKAQLKGGLALNTKYKLSAEFLSNKVNTHERIKKTGYDKNRTQESIVVFLEHQWTDRLNQNLTVRAPFLHLKAEPLIYVTALEYAIGREKNLKISTNFTRNYNRPTLNDLYFQPGGNADLKSEDGYTGEANFVYQFKKNNYDINFSSSIYKSKIDNWIIWLPNVRGYWEPFNIKKVKLTGLETKLDIKGNLMKKVDYRLVFNYAITKSINDGDKFSLGDKSIGKQLPFIPVNSGNMLMNIQYKDWFMNYNYTYYSERFTTSSNDRKKNDVKRDRLYPYHMSNMSVGRRIILAKKCLAEVKFKIDNLFDEDYRSILQRPMPRQNYTLLLDLKF